MLIILPLFTKFLLSPSLICLGGVKRFTKNCKPLIPYPDFLLFHCCPLQTIRPRPFKGVLIILPKLWPLYKTKKHLLFLLPNLCPRDHPVLHLLILTTLSVPALQRYPQASSSMTLLPSFSPPIIRPPIHYCSMVSGLQRLYMPCDLFREVT